jgi:hypothetical protein
MRRIVIGLLVAAVLVWVWPFGDEAQGGEEEAGQRADFAAMLVAASGSQAAAPIGSQAPPRGEGTPAPDARDAQSPPPAASPAPAPAVTPAASGAPSVDAEVDRAFGALVENIAAGDAAARSQGHRLLAREDLRDDHRARLRSMLGSSGAEPQDVDAVLVRLGSNNAFLHSAEGRELGRQVVESLPTLADERAVQVGTALLERCMRGPIERRDAAAIAFVDAAYKAHRVRADRYLCNPADLTRARSHTVAKGDNLAAIAAKFRREGIATEEGTLAALNRIHNMNAIQVGQRIRVPLDPVHVVIEKRSFLLAVYLGERILRLYWVGHGSDGSTPEAEFTVVEKLKDPDWYSPKGVIPFGSPQNILGRYFLKLGHESHVGFGIHGTPMPETIGTMASEGCIRMYDADIEELYRLLPRKAKVTVRSSQ